MSFDSISEFVAAAQSRNVPLWEAVLADQTADGGQSREDVLPRTPARRAD